jgi:hypothetical protein
MTVIVILSALAAGVMLGVFVFVWWEVRNEQLETELGIADLAAPEFSMVFFGGGPLNGEQRTVSLTSWRTMTDVIAMTGGAYHLAHQKVFPDAGGVALFEWRADRTVAA